MPTEKFKPNEKTAYDRTPVQVKVLPGVREKLKAIPGWQNLLRQKIDEIISGQSDSFV